MTAAPGTFSLVGADRGALRRPKSELEKSVERIKKIEERVYEKALTTLDDALRGADVDGTETEAPADWAGELASPTEKNRALRRALDIRMPSGVRPGYFDIAKAVVAGVQKSRERGDVNISGPLQVNVVVNNKQYAYPEQEVEDARE